MELNRGDWVIMKRASVLTVASTAVFGLFMLNACGDDGNPSSNNNPSSEPVLESSSSDVLYSSEALSSSVPSPVSSAGPVASSSSAESRDPVPEVSSSSVESQEPVPVSSSSQEISSSSEAPAVANTFKEDFSDECPEVKVPSGTSNKLLPDPFKKIDGSKVSSQSDWKCRREEISTMFQETEFGVKPNHPEKVSGKYSAGTLTVSVTDKGKTVSFDVTIKGNGTADKPVPAIIGFGGGSLGSSYDGMGVATISFDPDKVAPEKNRGTGPFYDLYGSSHSAGALIAWAWGMSRVIDALEVTPEAGIDVHHMGVTGCSRWGKGALVAGAFDARFALVIPQESGSGGASNWRSVLKDSKAQPLSSACTEAAWFKSSFCNYKDNNTYNLPTDHHMLTGMVAPRGLLVLDNQGWDWLGENPSYHNAMSTKEIFVALGAEDAFTFSKMGDHMHCTLPNSQYDEVKDFVNKYLLEKPATTGKIDKGNYSVNFTKADWIDWETPTLAP
ncbi:hypothetical protein SAMN05720468_1156 [Fibrobacter sp. UWEL]|nr:hypothetical protein SAMN05720468_1156 [Fibrobacter sp. UWEL]